jgi:excisionase family DNA binding protein
MTSPTMVRHRPRWPFPPQPGRGDTERVSMETAGQEITSAGVTRPQSLLRLREVAARLDLSVSSVRRLIRDRKLPIVKLNTAVRVRERDLEALIQAGSK